MYDIHDYQCIVFPCSSQINKKITHYIIDVDKIYLFQNRKNINIILLTVLKDN